MSTTTKTNERRAAHPSPELLARKDRSHKEHMAKLRSQANRFALGALTAGAIVTIALKGAPILADNAKNVMANKPPGTMSVTVGNFPGSLPEGAPISIASYAGPIAEQETKDNGAPEDTADVIARLQNANPGVNVFQPIQEGQPFNLASSDIVPFGELEHNQVANK